MKIAKTTGPILDKTGKDNFISHQTNLLREPITYIAPAVWGAQKDGELDETQKEMNRQIAPVIEEMLASSPVRDLNGPQKFAIGFLIRGLIISKITHMIESCKNRTPDKMNTEQENTYSPENIEPLSSTISAAH